MLPEQSIYGDWPRSGEIDLVECRGNRDCNSSATDHTNIGVQQMGSTLHFGPSWDADAWGAAHGQCNNGSGYNHGFHKYAFDWTDKYIAFKCDDQLVANISAADQSFWDRGAFPGDDIWPKDSKMAPFDQEVYYFYYCQS